MSKYVADQVAIQRPQPVMVAGKVAGVGSALATALATVVVVLGLVSQTDADAIMVAGTGAVGAVVTLVNLVLPILQSLRARDQVTPITDPRDASGVALRPVIDPATVTLDTGANPAP